MSTSVIHPGASARQTPSGKTIGMLVGGLAAAIVLGFVFYLNQSQDVTVSGVESVAAERSLDSWYLQHQASVNAARDTAAAYETARILAQNEARNRAFDESAAYETARIMAQVPAQASVPATASELIQQSIQSGLADSLQRSSATASELVEQSIQAGLAANLQRTRAMDAWADRLTGLAESFGMSPTAEQAWSDRLTGLAQATVGVTGPVNPELADKVIARQNQVSGTDVNLAFDHEFEPEPSSGPDSGSKVTVPAR